MSNDVIGAFGFVGMICACAAMIWLWQRREDDPWPWTAEAKQIRKRRREFSDRVAKAMELGMSNEDATGAVRAERVKESAAARKAYEEANK